MNSAPEGCEDERRSPKSAAGSFRPATTLYLGLPFAWRDLQEMAAADEKLLNAPARDDADVPIEEVEPPESSA